MIPVVAIVDGRVMRWLPGEEGDGMFRGALGAVVAANRAAAEGRMVKIGGARLRAEFGTPAGALVAMHAASTRTFHLLSGPEVCGSLIAWSYMLWPAHRHIHLPHD